MDNFLSQYVKDDWDAGKNDMSGLSSMYGDENGDIDDAELIGRVMDIEGSLTDENVAELWMRINAATRFAIDKEYESGLMTEDSYDRVNGMFDFYVPLRLFAEDTAEDVYQYMTGKGNASQFVGRTLKHAKGRKSEAKHPIATIFAMATRAIASQQTPRRNRSSRSRELRTSGCVSRGAGHMSNAWSSAALVSAFSQSLARRTRLESKQIACSHKHSCQEGTNDASDLAALNI
jgi:hypothetical protein